MQQFLTTLNLWANVAAALLWLLSAVYPRVPTRLPPTYGSQTREEVNLLRGLKLQARLNAMAAIMAGAGIALQALTSGPAS